jgi:uroporphyrinogen decarboxylase
MSYQDAMKYEGQFIKRLQEKTKVPFVLHNCGTNPYWNICEDINLAAVNGSHPLDIKFWIEFREKFPKITIMGAKIDVNREMLTGSPQDVEEKVKENIFNLAPKGRYVVAPICCLPWGVPLPNALAIPNTIEKYGRYPLQLPP